MNTMEVTKFVGAICGSLLVFLLIHMAGGAIFHVGHEAEAYVIPVEETEGGGGEEEQVDVGALMAAADAASGETVFRKCAACHKLDGSDGVGPHLNGIVNRAIGGAEGFSYSNGMGGHGDSWTPENLFSFLEDPKGFVPGTKMSFAGLPKPEDRANVIAYLEQQAN